ncbi:MULTISPECIES: hypothetical protein [Cloacibacterium]|uniref:Putative lipoprotein n=1 Tax=Cloacibacterium normanense TaxID=237258 RepID=A0A1E5UHM9_9FLAO|nr:hypothetical protein [Cloacibacterium normanense]AZI69526.1 hypothetical protein EB819_06365 [Cloacibacterium normanense]OEL12393.1 putative lipoprotein [Cloacibacterium normanense]SDO18600.1 hypothetical protein SAMN04489756_10272 [Cloacibacterium normanense]
MKKIITLSFLVIILVSCNNRIAIKYDDKNHQLTSLEKNFEKKTSPFLNITFEDYFKSDYIKIYVDKKLVYDKKISTSDILGVADSYELEKDFKEVIIYINNQKIILTKEKTLDYKNIYVNKLPNNKIEILISKKFHIYK